MIKTPLLALTILLNCTGCTYLLVSEAVDACDRSNVKCAEDERDEDRFKQSAKIDALVNDIGNTLNFMQSLPTLGGDNEDEMKTEDYYQYKECLDDEKYICSANNGCFCK